MIDKPYTGYITAKNGEIIGNNIIESGHEDDVCVYAITKFPQESIRETGDDTLLDSFIFSIMAVDAVTGGQIILFNAERRIMKMVGDDESGIINKMMPYKFMINARFVHASNWFMLGGADDEQIARAIFQSWMDYIGPNRDITFKLNGEQDVTIWEARPGFKTYLIAHDADPYRTKQILN